jgi:uncharacterized Zn finger protein
MAKKEALACKPCGYMVLVSDQGDAVIECYECGAELAPKATKKMAAKKAVKAVAAKKPAPKKTAAKKTAAKKPAAKKAAPKKKK